MISTKLFSRISLFNKLKLNAVYKSQNSDQNLILKCKNSKLNFYESTSYNKLDEVPLASKGWQNRKSYGDYFTIVANPKSKDNPQVPFADVQLMPEIEKVLCSQQVSALTRFQSEVIPKVRKGTHALIAAETGCGKTLAYLIPLVEELLQTGPSEEFNTPRVLILVPNRELAHQIGNVASILCAETGLKTKVIVGGHTKRLMLKSDYDLMDILVATPGAMSKLSTVGLYKLHNVQHTVIDEADTLLDDSFNDRIDTLIRRVPASRIILCSATKPKNLPASLEPIMETLLEIESPRLHRPLLNVEQKFMRLAKSAKSTQLLHFAKASKEPMIIFTNKNETCKWLTMFLKENGLDCSNINGDMKFDTRVAQWKDFHSGKTHILAATDVGSRGLDLIMLKQVLNYDFPVYMADYIHRVGRVGRLGSLDTARIINFVSSYREITLAQNIEMAIRTHTELKNVDGNITNLVQKRIMRSLRGAAT